jgi:hypothetical protein
MAHAARFGNVHPDSDHAYHRHSPGTMFNVRAHRVTDPIYIWLCRSMCRKTADFLCALRTRAVHTMSNVWYVQGRCQRALSMWADGQSSALWVARLSGGRSIRRTRQAMARARFYQIPTCLSRLRETLAWRALLSVPRCTPRCATMLACSLEGPALFERAVAEQRCAMNAVRSGSDFIQVSAHTSTL